MPFRVYVDDNYHYMDESERYLHGEFASLDEAVAAARRIVDDYLASALGDSPTADGLMASYCSFGEDPFIIADPPVGHGVLFSAREYARQRCRELFPPDPPPGATG